MIHSFAAPTHRCFALAILPLALLIYVSPADAQRLTLQSGTAEISGTGTQVSSYDNVSPPNYTFSGGASAATHDYSEVDASTSTTDAQLFGGGSITTLNAQNEGQVGVFGGAVTTMNSSTGSYAGVYGGMVLTANNTGDGTVSVEGGTVETLNNDKGDGSASIFSGKIVTLNNTGSLANVVGGAVTILNNNAAYVYDEGGVVNTLNNDNSTVRVLGGDVTSFNNASDGILSLESGSIMTLDNGLGGTATVTGGNIDTVGNDSTLSVSQGVVSSLTTRSGGSTNLTGGQFHFLDNFTGGLVDIFGRGLALKNGYVTGTLQDGEAIDAAYKNDGGILLLNGNPVPEASPAVSLGVLLALGMIGIVVKARSRQVALQSVEMPKGI